MKKDDHWSPLQINYSEKIKMKYIAPLIGVLFQVKGGNGNPSDNLRLPPSL